MIGPFFGRKQLSEEELIAASDEQCARVEELLRSDDLQDAIRLTKRFQKRFPNNKRGIGNSAIMISDAGDVHAAIAFFTTLHQHNPEDSYSLLNLAVCYNRLEQREIALEYVQEAYCMDPDNPGTCVCLSESYFYLDMVEESEQICLDAIERGVDHHLLWFGLGCCKMRQGDSYKACDPFKKSLDMNPNHFESLANYAAALVGMKEWDEAEKLVLRALEIRPDDGVTICNLAQIYEAQDRPDDAYGLYLRSTEIDPEYDRAYEDVQRMREQLGLSDDYSD